MGNFQKYWSQNVGQDFIVLDFFVGGRSCGRKSCVREINVSRAWDPVHAGDKALTRETPMKRGRVNRYALSCHTIFKPINSSWHQKSEPDTQIQIHSGTYRHQKTATNTHSSPGLSHFGINCLQHLPLQTQLTVSRAWSQYLPWFQFSHHNYHSYWFIVELYQMYIVLTFDSLFIAYML